RDRPLDFLDREIVEELMHQMRDRGVVFRLGETVQSVAVAQDPRPRAVVKLESGKVVSADGAFFSIRRIGAAAGLRAEAARRPASRATSAAASRSTSTSRRRRRTSTRPAT